MGRPPLPLGTYGEIRCNQIASNKWRARAKYRDYDGKVRDVERIGRSKTGAKENLRTALRDRSRAVAGDEVMASTKLEVVAEMWLRELDESDKALRTKRTYRESWTRDVQPAVGALRGSEITVSLATRVLRTVHDTAGPGSAQHAKVVLGGIMGLYVRHDAIENNPIREVVLPKSGGKKAKKGRMVLEPEELPKLRKHLRGRKKAVRRDLPGVVDGLGALGCRIGELLALDWSKVDFAAGTIAIEGTVIRVTGDGLMVQPHTKSGAGMRTITVPAWYVDILNRRNAESESPWVYPTSTGTLRDPDNTRADLREAVDGTEWEGLHPHAFRHLVATVLDAAGLSAREIADYLGHERVSMTQDVYMHRKSKGRSAADALAKMQLES
ncbi:site-specific integrase [Saccharopolyspora sp. NFXS83]|uniref:site-specific integrase n=1 Tax=Saccharopolyspora sp. NFXS83 TaxID=2993560 RepID=UPI00224AC794|nr:site-specific integrase [Saccharopolyspora sp. NFXS83]MCX2732012.1 site-specific integrase [Saccharopolyspora sp. NFXS83]